MTTIELELQARFFAIRFTEDQYRALRAYEADTRAIPLIARLNRLEAVSDAELAGPLAPALYFRLEEGADPQTIRQLVEDRLTEIATAALIQSKVNGSKRIAA